MRKQILFITAILFLATSCSIEKRHYMKGFHVKRAKFQFYDINKSEPVLTAENYREDSVQNDLASICETKTFCITETTETEIVNDYSTQNRNPEIKLLKEKKLIVPGIISKPKHEHTLLPDSTHKSHVKQNKKNMSEEEGDEIIEYLLGTEIMLSFCLLMGLIFVFNPTLGMMWLSVCLFFPMAVICLITSLYLFIKALVGLFSGWYTPEQRKNIQALLLWAIINFILAAILTTLLIAMWA